MALASDGAASGLARSFPEPVWPSGPTAHELRWAALVFAVYVLAFYWPVPFGRTLTQTTALASMSPWSDAATAARPAHVNRMLDDQTREFLPFFLIAREAVRRGELPLWNPSIFAGTPLLADSQSALLFPLNLGHYLLPPPWGFTVSGLLKPFLACLFAYLLARSLRLSHPAGLIAGLSFGFATFNQFWLGHPHTNVTLLFPLLLLGCERLAARPDRRAIALVGMLVGLQVLGGHVELIFVQAVGSAVFVVARALQRRRRLPSALAALFASYALGLALGAMVLVPLAEFLSNSVTWGARSASNPFFAPPASLLTLVSPGLFRSEAWGEGQLLQALSLYFGTLPLLLALFAILARPGGGLLAVVAMAAVGALLAFGVPPFRQLALSLPLFRQNPNYYAIVLVLLAGSLLAGGGYDALLARAPGRGGRALVLLLASSAIALAAMIVPLVALRGSTLEAAAAALGAPDAAAVGRLAVRLAVHALILQAASIVAALCLVFAGARSRAAGWGAIALVGLDLFLASGSLNPSAAPSEAFPPAPPGLSALASPGAAPRVAGIGEVLPPNTGVYLGLRDIRGYDVPVAERFHDFFHRALGGSDHFWIYDLPALDPSKLPFFGAAAVGSVLLPRNATTDLPVVFRGRTFQVVENPYALPRASFITRTEVVADREAAMERVLALGEKLREVVVIERDEAADREAGVEPEGGSTPPLERAPAVRIARDEAARVALEVDAPAAGWLVLADSAYPGWIATLDGHETPIRHANFLFRAVWLPAGSHVVVFSYAPLSVRVGWGVALLAAAVVAWALLSDGRGSCDRRLGARQASPPKR